MPGGDRTGPTGYGSRTGRGLGYCSGYDSPGFTKGTPRCGRGWGRGFGHGFWRHGRGFWHRVYYPEPYYGPESYYRDTYPEYNKENEKTYLENLVKDLEEEIKQVKQRLNDISKEKKETS